MYLNQWFSKFKLVAAAIFDFYDKRIKFGSNICPRSMYFCSRRSFDAIMGTDGCFFSCVGLRILQRQIISRKWYNISRTRHYLTFNISNNVLSVTSIKTSWWGVQFGYLIYGLVLVYSQMWKDWCWVQTVSESWVLVHNCCWHLWVGPHSPGAQ